MSPVSEVVRPAGVGRRTSKPKYTAKEIEQAVSLLDKGKTPGVGPFDDQKPCRSALQSLRREIAAASTYPAEELGTQAWLSPEDQKWYGLVRQK